MDEACRVLWASGGTLQMRHHQQLVSRLPDEVHKAVSRICVPVMPLEALSASLPVPPHPPAGQLMTQ